MILMNLKHTVSIEIGLFIAFGGASYIILKFISGRAKEAGMVAYVVGIIIVLYFMFIL